MMDHFQRLGLPRRFSVDLEQIEREYLARSREIHPDFHSGATASQQAASLDATARLNEAYLALRDPIRRGEYLLQLLGGPKPQDEKNLDQLFLMEMMELREQIEDSRGQFDRLQTVERELQTRIAGVVSGLAEAFAKLEQDQEAAFSPMELSRVRRALNAARTLQSLQRELDNDTV